MPRISPQQEGRLRDLDLGPYYVAPDSAEPLPNSIWERIDPEYFFTEEFAEDARRAREPMSPEGLALFRKIGGDTWEMVQRHEEEKRMRYGDVVEPTTPL